MYGYSNPVKYTDPSGKTPLDFSLCFGLGTGIISGDTVTAGDAVNICKNAYNKDFWGLNPSKKIPSSVYDLFAWYVHEVGGQKKSSLYFNANNKLTQELAGSKSVDTDVRNDYYINGEFPPKFFQFETIDGAVSEIYDGFPVSLTQFLGSYYYQVKEIGNNRIGIRIDNDTTLSSGSHIRDRFSPDYVGSVEDLILNNPSLQYKKLSEVVAALNVISILSDKTRNQTSGSQGGGTMYQTYIWTESTDCTNRLLFSATGNIRFLDIKPWNGYRSATTDPFKGRRW
jgi:hypothetical protein